MSALIQDPEVLWSHPMRKRILGAVLKWVPDIGTLTYRDRTDFVDVFVAAGAIFEEHAVQDLDGCFQCFEQVVIDKLHSEEVRANCLHLLTLREAGW